MWAILARRLLLDKIERMHAHGVAERFPRGFHPFASRGFSAQREMLQSEGGNRVSRFRWFVT
jgi:hypothetical protein